MQQICGGAGNAEESACIHPLDANLSVNVSASAVTSYTCGHQATLSSGHQATLSSGHQATLSSGHQATLSHAMAHVHVWMHTDDANNGAHEADLLGLQQPGICHRMLQVWVVGSRIFPWSRSFQETCTSIRTRCTNAYALDTATGNVHAPAWVCACVRACACLCTLTSGSTCALSYTMSEPKITS